MATTSAKPVISLVIGTYNRAPTLHRAISSFVANVWRGLPYEIIVLDNGSTDDTKQVAQRWGAQYRNYGKPVGAIRAFTDGCYMARGDYVQILTDDSQLTPGSLLKAFVHLEDSRTCASVTYQHNKARKDFKADYQHARLPNGKSVLVPYPQISLTRKSAGDAAGWWGARHGMKGGFTYGGDNYLGARLIELGYTVDVVEGVTEIEDVIQDAPRKLNADRHRADHALFMTLYPDGVPIPHERKVDGKTRLRVLLLNSFEQSVSHHRLTKRGLREAWQDVAHVYEYDWQNRPDDYLREMTSIIKDFKPHLFFAQMHNAPPVHELCYLRSLAPAAPFVNWIGDVWERLYVGQVDAWRHIDALGVVNMDMLGPLRAAGVNALHLNNAFEPTCHTTYNPRHKVAKPRKYDVIFQGNAYSPARRALGAFLRGESLRKYKVALIGNGWQDADGSTYWQYEDSQALYKDARIAISTNEFGATGYVSNRVFEVMAVGTSLLFHQATPELDKWLGMKHGVHYIEWHDHADLERKLAFWLDNANEDERKRIVHNAYHLTHRKHAFKHRVKQVLTEVMDSIKDRHHATT
jgi:glycosyltransferase involved in cell wall biosynthesis